MLVISPNLVIDDAELQERFVRSSGPGGQNVNKVNTKVRLWWGSSGDLGFFYGRA
jgi:ribosome-associated protein